jgi:hypothetical protein
MEENKIHSTLFDSNTKKIIDKLNIPYTPSKDGKKKWEPALFQCKGERGYKLMAKVVGKRVRKKGYSVRHLKKYFTEMARTDPPIIIDCGRMSSQGARVYQWGYWTKDRAFFLCTQKTHSRAVKSVRVR